MSHSVRKGWDQFVSVALVMTSLLGAGVLMPEGAWSWGVVGAHAAASPNETRIRELISLLANCPEGEGYSEKYELSKFEGEAFSFIFDALLDPATKDAGRSNLMDVLNQVSSKEAALSPYLPRMFRLLDDSYDQIRYMSVHILNGFYPESYPGIREAFPRVIELLLDPSEKVRGGAAYFFARLGRDAAAEPAIPNLIRALQNDASYDVRESAAYALGTIGRRPDVSVPALLGALKDENYYVRSWSIRSLEKFPSQAGAIVPALIEVMRNDEENRQTAVRALGVFGEASAPAVGVLEHQMYEDKDINVRGDSADTLGKIGQAALEVLLKASASSDKTVRWVATDGLTELGPIDARILDRIKERLKDGESLVRNAAVHATLGMKDKSPMFLPQLDWMAENDTFVGGEAKLAAMLIRSRMK